MNLSVGDTVIVDHLEEISTYNEDILLNGKRATIVGFVDNGNYAQLEFKENVDGHSCNGLAKYGYGWNIRVSRLSFAEKNKVRNSFYLEDGLVFYINEEECAVTYQDNRTIVRLTDGTKGNSKCSPEDDFDPKRGREIAYRRAKLKQMQREAKKMKRELEKLCKF